MYDDDKLVTQHRERVSGYLNGNIVREYLASDKDVALLTTLHETPAVVVTAALEDLTLSSVVIPETPPVKQQVPTRTKSNRRSSWWEFRRRLHLAFHLLLWGELPPQDDRWLL